MWQSVPQLCHMSRLDQLQLLDFFTVLGVTSVRAGCRQVIDVSAIVDQNAFRPDNGRTVVDFRFARQNEAARAADAAAWVRSAVLTLTLR